VSNLVFVLNGPNLNLLGERNPEIYGHETLADVEADCRAISAELIDWIHEARKIAFGIIINPAAFSHTSVAILDALNTFDGPVLEVHISNIHKRESFRHHSFVTHRADGVMAGYGVQGYNLALRRLGQLAQAAGHVS